MDNPTDLQFRSAQLRQDFALFLRFAFAEVGGARTYYHNWHIDAIIEQLDQIAKGTNRRLIVTMPPRHLKSITISTAWVAWMLGKDPTLRFICVSYGSDLSEKHARDCLRIMLSDWYREAFPNTSVVRRATMDFETSVGGGRLSTSVHGVLTGRGANIIIIDDPMKADDALSETARVSVHEWYATSLVSRMDNPAKSSIILVMQRLHEADLAGNLLQDAAWRELRLSAIATQDERIALTRGRYHQRRTGYPLHASRQSLATLAEKRIENSYVFAAQYQQDPVARVGRFVEASWFGTYDQAPTSGLVVQSWDTASKTTVRNDWSVGITARFYNGRYYILDVFRKRVEFGGLLAAVRTLCRYYNVDRLLIEDASSGQQLIPQLRADACDGAVRPIAVTSSVNKIVRFEAQAARIESGMVVLPQAAPWLADFINEVARFPAGRHDDQADALAQMLAHQVRVIEDENAGPILYDESGILSGGTIQSDCLSGIEDYGIPWN